jgi:hypothetical protein
MNLKSISSKTITSKLPILIASILSLVVVACAIVLIHKSPMPPGSGEGTSMPASSRLVAYGGQAVESGEPGWPRTITSGDTTILFYPPQIDTWNGDQIEAYAAVSVQTGQSEQQTYGKVYFTTHAVTDKTNRQVTLDRFKVTKGDFPSAPDKTNDYLAIIQQAEGSRTETVPPDELLSNLAAAQAEHKSANDLKNDPPRVIFSTTPAVLVLIDGQPVLRSAGEGDLQRVINTRALILFDQTSGTYYMSLMGGWVQAAAIEGPWTFARGVPSAANRVKTSLASSGQVDLLNGEPSGRQDQAASTGRARAVRHRAVSGRSESLSARMRDGTFPTVYVSTVQAELLTAQGDMQLKPIPNTGLMYVSNSSDQILLDAATRDYYVLISGRWFAAKSMGGPWRYVAAKDLPKDFAKIPEGDPKAAVLASTPGTVAAREAVIANEIPQTATINRQEAQLTVTYDGDPRFELIPGTHLECAVNSATPVIEVRSNDFLAVQDGVWFASTSALGPWAVATSVPPEVYSIPTRHRLHNVTYARVYGYNDDYVYTGYTPGYYGTLLASDDLVVYGSGWDYSPYIGSYWLGWPATYGFGAGFFWAPTVGWGFGFGEGFVSPFYSPWWTPFGFGAGFPEVAFVSPAFGFGFVPVFNVGWGFPVTSFAFGSGFGWAPSVVAFNSGFGFRSGFASSSVSGFNVFGRWGGAALVGTRAAWSGGRIATTTTRQGMTASAGGGRFANGGGVAGNRFGGPMGNSMTGAGSRASAAASRAAVGAMAGSRMNGRGAAAGARANGFAGSRSAMAGARTNMGSRGALAGSRANMGSRGAFGASRATVGGGRFAASRGAMSAPRIRGGSAGSRGGFAPSRGAMSAPQMRGGFGGSRGGAPVMRGGGGAGRSGSFAAPRGGGFGGGGARMGGGGSGGGARMGGGGSGGGGARMSAGGGGRGGRHP